MRRSNCAESVLRTFRSAKGSITLQIRSKRRKVRGHRAIAPFSGVGRIVDDRYPARVSSSDRSGKAIVCRVELLNGGFRAAVAITRLGGAGRAASCSRAGRAALARIRASSAVPAKRAASSWIRVKFGCWGATEQKTGLSKFQATSSRTSAGFLNGRNSPRVTASGTEKA
jgi:hypothetical protein